MRKISLVFILAVLFTVSGYAAPQTFVVDDPGGRNTASFTSRATIETIVGTTNNVTGSVAFDPENLSKPAVAKVIVDLRTVTTGIKLRDEHMNGEQYLNTAVYPFAVFELNAPVQGPALTPGQKEKVSLIGKFTVHGVTKDVVVTGTATYIKEIPEMAGYGYPGDLFSFDGNFTIKLPDFNINVPQLLMLKLSEEQLINVQFTATTGRKPAPQQ